MDCLDGEFIWFYVRLNSNGSDTCWKKLYIHIYKYATPCKRIYLSRKNVLTLMVVAPTKYDRLKSKVRFAFMSVYHMTIYNDRHTHYSFIKSEFSVNYCINIYFSLADLPRSHELVCAKMSLPVESLSTILHKIFIEKRYAFQKQ